MKRTSALRALGIVTLASVCAAGSHRTAGGPEGAKAEPAAGRRAEGREQMKAHFILYVSDQKASAAFYAGVLGARPRLDVPGMTEFRLNGGAVLGLMPAKGIKRLLGDWLPDPERGAGIPRAELYLLTEDPAGLHRRALANGAVELSALQARDWGHEAAYSLDPDGHVIAFARELELPKSRDSQAAP